MRFLAFSVAAVSLTSACQSTQTELTAAERSAIRQEITAVLQLHWDSWRAVDYELGMSFYLDSPETVFTGQGVTLSGFASISETFRPVFTNVARQDVNLDETHLTVLARNAVHVTESGSYAQFDDRGAEIRAAPFSFSTTWVLRDGEWKIVTCHQSERQPPAG